MRRYFFKHSYSRAEIVGLLGLIAAIGEGISVWIALPCFFVWACVCHAAEVRT